MSPVLETERLILRRPEPADASPFIEFTLSDRAKYTFNTKDRHMAWTYFAADLGHWEIRGWGQFTVVERDTGTLCGAVGPFFPDGWNEQEIGWLIWEHAEGKGIAYEATVAVRRFCYNTLGWTTAISNIEADNTRSIRLAERLGCTIDPSVAKVDPVDLVYRHPAPEALQ